MSGEHHRHVLCATLGASRSSYYAWRQRRPSPRALSDHQLTAQIARLRGTYGSRRIVHEPREQGQHVGHIRVARLMRTTGLWGRQRRRYRVVTTDSHRTEPIAPNRLAEQPPPSRPDQVCVSDLTYVPTAEGWLYVADVLDRYGRCLVGWAMGASLETALPLAALQMALRQRRPPAGLIHHSDRGVQYASVAYRVVLGQHGLVASMSRPAHCYDNAVMEALWSSLKNELVHRHRFASRAEAQTAIFDYIEGFYNRTRKHSALGYKSPLDYESSLN